MAKKKMTQFAVIGLGRFGMAVAKELHNQGNEVLAVDTDPDLARAAQLFTTHTACADASDEQVLKELDIASYDAVIICIGGSVEASVFTTLVAKQLGAEYVIVKALNPMHKSVLEKIGADLVILPEDSMGVRLATMLTHPNMVEVMELTDNYRIIEIITPSSWQNKKLSQIALRNKFEVTLLVIKRGEDILSNITADTVLHKGDALFLGGSIPATEKIRKKATDRVEDIEDLI